MPQPRPVTIQNITPSEIRQKSDQNPTATRYGYSALDDIDLRDLGVVHYRVQPEGSPYFEIQPRCELIPFVTFDYETFERDESGTSSPSNPNPIKTVPVTKYAATSALEIARAFSRRGFIIINSFTGLDQEKAGRIFRVIQPFAYKLNEIEAQLGLEAEDRISSETDFEYDLGGGETYRVEALWTDKERDIARLALSEMRPAVAFAVSEANATLDDTATSMTTRYAGGQGKSTPDARDRHLADQMNFEFPRIGGDKPDGGNADVARKIDYLVGKEQTREEREEKERLEQENARMRAQLAEMQGEREMAAMETEKPKAKGK